MNKVVFLALALGPGLAGAAEPEAVTRQLARPVLIRNEQNGIVYEGSGSHLVFEKISIDELLKR